jgi:hypothetical protein
MPWPPVEPILPMEAKPPADDSSPRITSMAESERPTRFTRIALAVAVLSAIVAGAGYWLRERGERPTAVKSTPASSSPARQTPPTTEPPLDASAPHLATGLRPLTDQRSDVPPAEAPVAAQSPAPAPSAPPKFAVGLPPITEQMRPEMPAPAADAPPQTEPPPTPIAPPKPRRNTSGHPPSSAVSPSPSSGTIKF